MCVEGVATEDLYLTRWKRLFRGTVNIEIDSSKTAPLSIVRLAVERKRAEEKNRRRGRSAHDEVWCMFDVDEHPNLDEALGLARDHDIGVALSNPCLEMWFLLHFKDYTAHIERHAAQHECKKILGCGKNLTSPALDMLVDHHDEAADRARKLAKRHQGNGSRPDSNPSSNVWELIASIRGE